MKYLLVILAFFSFNASAAYSLNECANEQVSNKITSLYSFNITEVDETLSSIDIKVPDKLLDKYVFSRVYFVVSKYQQIILSGHLQTESKNEQQIAKLFIRDGMINNLKIYAYYDDQLSKVLYDTNFCKFELKAHNKSFQPDR